jgi:hypothetical protein
MGGQTLTYAICRSGCRGLDLFLTTSSSFGLLGLGRWQVGQCRAHLEGWFFRCGPFWAGGSGAGVADTGFGLNPLAVTDLMKQNQLYHYTIQKG